MTARHGGRASARRAFAKEDVWDSFDIIYECLGNVLISLDSLVEVLSDVRQTVVG